MLQISQQIAFQRWDTLTDVLREALFDNRNTEIVKQIAAAEHLSDDKRKVVSRIAGWVLMGFVHPEDAAQEIKDAAGIDLRIANVIAGSLNAKIFSPLRSDIEKMYAVPVEKATEVIPSEAPKQPIMVMAFEATGKSSINGAPEKNKNVPTEVLATSVPPVPPKLGAAPKIAPQPVNFPIAEKEVVNPIMPPGRVSQMNKIGFPAPTPPASVVTSTPKPSVPPPIMLHREVNTAPVASTPTIRSGNLVSKNLIGDKPKSAPPPPVARLEFAHNEDKPKIVNYSAQNTPLPPMPSTPITAPAQGVQGTRVAASPATPIPPQKSSAPSPASAPITPPKTYAPPQANMPATAPAPSMNLGSIIEKPLPHTLDLSSKPPPPPPPNLPI